MCTPQTPRQECSNSCSQYPGGLTLWLTRVHFGNSIDTFILVRHRLGIAHTVGERCRGRTVDAFAVLLLFPIEDCVLVLGQHLLFSRHFRIPSLNGFGCQVTIFLQCAVHSVHDRVNESQAFSLTRFLRA